MTEIIEITEIQIGDDKRRIKDDKAIYSDALNDALQQYLKKEEATSAYQPKGDYLTSIPEEYVTEEELNAKGYLTEHQDISNLATKEELSSKADSSAIADMLTKTEAASTYQPKGDYLTDVPDEYVTETELNGKGYATTTQLSDAVADKLTKTQADEYYQATGDYALKSEIPDVSGFLTPTQADGKYATLAQIGDIETILDNIIGG